ncbi:antibiotic biosynthesis monooxygenase [Dermacoccus nishinomiyaensis]|uniref:antibiotic biosynthesis monooxygenase n=1 Tax=Dermacoccus nishinomiyaensis TaxID=1274 RepID=UPI001EF47812|nr:antibiotic biosynthesis monooxygenase [Dermacoccus nishinomiyaensis]
MPEDPQRLTSRREAVTASEEVMRHLPGFISGNFHASTDGSTVVNYVQWESRETLQAAQTDAAARVHMDRAMEIAERIEPRIYTVEAVHHR